MGGKNIREFGFVIGKSKSLKKPYLFSDGIIQAIIKAKEYEYSTIEPHLRDPKEVNTNEVLKYSKKYNIKISGISTGLSFNIDKLSLISDLPEIKNSAIKRLKEYIDLANIIGGFIIIGTMRGNIPYESEYEFYLEKLSESMKTLTEYAINKNVALLLEAANRYESNYLNRVEEVFNFITNYKIQNLKILMDTFHMNIEEKDMNKSIRKYGKLLGYFHISDSNRMYPGAGHINFREIVKSLNSINYNGYIILECFPLPSGKIAANKALTFIRSIM